MKKILFLTKTLLAVALLCVGQNAWAVDVPTPVYFNDFSSTDGLTIVGSGEFITDGDSRFGKIYHNNPTANTDRRSNYLLLPEDVLTHSGTSNAMTIGFWVNRKADSDYFYCPLFSAYKTTTPGSDNGMPMFICQSRGTLQVNDGAGKWSDFTAAYNDAGSNTESTVWLDDNGWHYYTVTLTSTTAKVYVDGEIVNSWTMDGTSNGQVISGLFSAGAANNLTKVCLGGNQAWGWKDKDASFGFDDFAVYDEALSAEQIGQVINNKLVQDATLLEYGTGDVAWTTAKVAEWTAGGSPTLADGIVTISGGNGSYETSKTISPTAGNIINLTAVWRGASSTGRDFSKSNGSYFRFGNIIVAQNDQDQKHGYGFTGLDNIASVTTFSAGSYRVDVTSSTWLKIEAEINTATNTLTSFTIKSEDGATTYVNLSNQALTSPDYTTIAFGYKKTGSVSTTNKEQLKSIKITQTVPSATYADYTVHFKDNNGATVKEDEVRNGEVGETVNANNVDKETFYDGGYKYVYANDGDGVEVTSDGTAELTVTYTKKGQFTYNVYAVNNAEPAARISDTPIATSTVYEGETAVVRWSKYIKIGEQWYSTSESSFYATATSAGSKNVVYTTASIDGFYEMENLTRSGGAYLTEENNSYSNRLRIRLSRGSKYYTPALTEGVYRISIPWQNSNGTANEVYVRTRDSKGVYSDKLLTFTATAQQSGTFTGEISVPDGYSVAFDGNEASDVNNNARMDYMTLTKITSVSKTISAAGWATYSNSCALDFSSSIEHLDAAYIVTGGEDGVLIKTPVTGTVPANTGLLLKGNGVCAIPVAVSGDASNVTGNKLVGVTTSTEIAAEAGYVLMNDPTNGLGFYKNTNAFTVGAKTAYLPADFAGGSGSARSAYFFRGDITGVANVEAAAEAKAQDGKFIENGKLVIVKNGVKYNAAGQQVK